MATLFGGTARTVTRTPEGRVLLTDRSGVPGAGDRVRELLLAAGVAPEQLRVRRGAPDAITRVIVTRESLAAAPFYADLLGVGWQQIDRFAVDADIEVILGQDAARFDLFRRAQAPTPQMSTPPSSPHVSTGG